MTCNIIYIYLCGRKKMMEFNFSYFSFFCKFYIYSCLFVVLCVVVSPFYCPSIIPEVLLWYSLHTSVLQVRTLASAGGPDNVVMLDPGKYKARPRVPEPAGDSSSTHPKWQLGEQEYEALMRMLDNLVRITAVSFEKSISLGRQWSKTPFHVVFFQGYRTGYPYRCPALRDKAKKYSDAETSSTYGDDSDSGARSPLKHSFQRGQRDKTRWQNSGSRPDEPFEDGPDGSSPKSKPKVWTNITHDQVKPLLQSLSSGVCVPSCITNCLVCAYLIVHSIDFTPTLLVEMGRWPASWASGDTHKWNCSAFILKF